MIKALVLSILLFFSIANISNAQELQTEEVLEAEVAETTSKGLELLVTKGSLQYRTIFIDKDTYAGPQAQNYTIGEKLLVVYSKNIEGDDVFYISDYVRRKPLGILFAIFALSTVIVAGRWGISSLLGMAITFLMIFLFLLPQILKGANPVFIAVLGSAGIIPITFGLSHGLNKKTAISAAGTIIALVLTGILAWVFIEVAHLTGFSTEEAGFLQMAKSDVINMKGILLAGIIIGALGALDDVTVSQAAVVTELHSAQPKLKLWQLYRRAMKVGKDHIASAVNTLVLVYTGASLPLLLLFVDNPRSISEVINYEIIAEELVRTLTGSIGLISAVPITTFLASFIISKSTKKAP